MTPVFDNTRPSADFWLTWRQPQRPRAHILWQWILRLALPILTVLGSTVLYWIWFDNVYGHHWGNTIGGIALAVTMLLVAVWSIGAWCSDAS
jgi:hypothetical protein